MMNQLLDDTFDKMDVDGNRMVDLEEFLRYTIKDMHNQHDTREHWNTFNLFDHLADEPTAEGLATITEVADGKLRSSRVV
jgi:Ca2+-binding EF-hand superfamily protein